MGWGGEPAHEIYRLGVDEALSVARHLPLMARVRAGSLVPGAVAEE
jgi:hypothetical protein